MKKIDKELKAIHVFHEHMEKNIFYTRETLKLESEVKISKNFPIYIKNPNEFELQYIMDNNYKELFSIVSIFPSLKELMQINDFFVPDIYCAFKEYIFGIHDLYRRYIEEQDKEIIEKSIENNDKKSFCAYLSSLLNEEILLIEVKDWKKIDNYISQYFNCDIDEVEDLDYRIYFIEQYINYFNIINFDLRIFKGITLLSEEKLVFVKSYFVNNDFQNAMNDMLSKPFLIDSFVKSDNDIMTLFFIIHNFEKSRYMRERKYVVDIVTCLELFLIKKLNDSNNKIEEQFKFKVQKCCESKNYFIPINELKELYNYRSIVVHGNVVDINRKINEITVKKWYKEYSSKMDKEYGWLSYDNNDKENLIFCRLFEIFNIIFRMYCEENNKINLLKEIVSREEIKNFNF